MDVCALSAIELRAAGGRLQSDDNQLEERCKQWITGMRGQFTGTPTAAQAAPASPVNFKMA